MHPPNRSCKWTPGAVPNSSTIRAPASGQCFAATTAIVTADLDSDFKAKMTLMLPDAQQAEAAKPAIDGLLFLAEESRNSNIGLCDTRVIAHAHLVETEPHPCGR